MPVLPKRYAVKLQQHAKKVKNDTGKPIIKRPRQAVGQEPATTFTITIPFGPLEITKL